MSDRHNIFGEPERPRPAQTGPGTEQRQRIPLVKMKDDDGGRGQRPPQQGKQRRNRLLLVILADILLAGLLILIFFMTEFITPEAQGNGDTPDSSIVTESSTPAPTDTVAVNSAKPNNGSATPSPNKTATLSGMWRTKFADKFTSGEVVKTDTSYKSANINITVTKTSESNQTYYVADIYLADIKYFKTWLGGQTDKTATSDHVDAVSTQLGGIVAINGDYFLNNKGLLIRNGKDVGLLISGYGDVKTSRDSLVMYKDGTMKTFTAKEFDINKVKSESPYQVWSFGPELLDNNGQAMTTFNSTVNTANPRTAIGYYEPGHYCFVVVDGRDGAGRGHLDGFTTTQLSQFFHDKLKCKVAYNLDGGGSSQIAFMGKRINLPCSDFRKVCDMLYITDK